LAGIYGLVSNGDELARFQAIVEGAIDSNGDVGSGGGGSFVFGFGGEFGTGEEIGSAAEVGDELADGGACGGTGEDDGIVKAAGGDAATRFGIDASETEVSSGEKRGASGTNILQGFECMQFTDGDLRIVAESKRFSLRK